MRATARLSRYLALCFGLGLVTLASGCNMTRQLQMPVLAHAEVATDFDTYALRRVGLMPVAGLESNRALAQSFRQALQAELSRSAPYELVILTDAQLEAVEDSEPHLKGAYRPRTILALTQRYNLGGLLFPTITQQRDYPPQELGIVLDLVAAETGLAVWSGRLQIDANDPAVVMGLKVYYGVGSKEAPHPWELALLSPERFSRFAAYQLALLL
ncbi:MAG: hypothetical protein ACI8QS_002247 [Planctomycetota bacterium]|jgi:hypothetical protein